MSDVVVSVVESTTAVTVTEQDVAVAITETSVDVSTSTAGVQGATGATGVGYTGVTSVSTITIGSGLKTFTLVAGYAGAFITGMRIRAIHSDTPTYYLEGTANYVGAGTLIITVDKFNGSGSHNSWAFASAGEVGQTGATGASGVVSVTSPITNTGTSGSAIVGIDQTLLSITRSQVSDFTSGTVTSASTAQQAGTAVYSTTSGTAVFANTSGTATFSTNSGTAVNISGTVTQSQVTNLTTDLAAKAPLASPTFSGTVTLPFTNAGIVHSTSAGVLGVSAAAPGLGYIPYTASVTGLYAWQDISLVARDNTANAFTVGGHSITNDAAGTVPLFIRGASGQTANLFEIQNNAGTVLSRVTSTGIIETGQYVNMTTNANAGIAVGGLYRLAFGNTNVATQANSSGATTVGLVVKGAASQSANLQEWQNSSGTILASINPSGTITGGLFGGTYGRFGTDRTYTDDTALRITAQTAGQATVQIKGFASQTANLQEWQNSGGTVIAKVDSVGDITARVQRSTFAARFTTTDPSIAIQVNTAAASQTGDFIQMQNSGGTVLAKVDSAGIVYGAQVRTASSLALLTEASSGGAITLARPTAAFSNPGANTGRLYFRDGTTAGTLKLVVRAGAAGAETTILDNIPQ
jgi:hypothetical protein